MSDIVNSLFYTLEWHLLNDKAPSEYCTSIVNTPDMEIYPFNLIKRMQATKQSPQHHPEGNVWNHTLLVIDQAAKRKQESTNPRVFMWAAMLHDLGKPVVTKARKGKITAYNHDKTGAVLAEEFLNTLHQEPAFITSVCNLVRYHMHILYVIKDLPFADINAMLESVDIYDIALLGLCDRLGRTGADRKAEEDNIRYFLQLCKKRGERRKGTQ